jgi:signal transduction histidine kinase
MGVDGKKTKPERVETDESLRAERAKVDRELARYQEAIDEDADQVIDRARENADVVLATARAREDQLLEQAAASVATPTTTVVEERALEDEVLRVERAAADEALSREREESDRLLSPLLPMEREKTDRHLLTERVRSDDALSNRDDFLGIVSHDLRNLLGAIVMSSALLSKRAPEGDEGKATRAETERIQRYAARMNRLVGDLLDVASIDSGRLAVAHVRSDAAALVAETVEMFMGSASAKGVDLAMELAERPLWADFDHDRMLQVLANLIANAIKFTPRGGSIRVRGERAEGGLLFTVSDTGAGIASDMLENIFKRFWQVSENDRRGVGLGLYIVRSVVDAHGGRVWAESELGKGSRFYFTLPVSAAATD